MLQSSYARLTKQDVQRLQAALDTLAALGQTIASSGYKTAPLMLTNLAAIISDLEPIKLKGANAIVRWMQRNGQLPPGEQPEAGASSAAESQEPLMRPELEEG